MILGTVYCWVACFFNAHPPDTPPPQCHQINFIISCFFVHGFFNKVVQMNERNKVIGKKVTTPSTIFDLFSAHAVISAHYHFCKDSVMTEVCENQKFPIYQLQYILTTCECISLETQTQSLHSMSSQSLPVFMCSA